MQRLYHKLLYSGKNRHYNVLNLYVIFLVNQILC